MRIRIQSVPFWPVIFALSLLLGAAVTCREQAGKAINEASLWTDAQGRPMDNAGDGLQCPEPDCPGVLWYVKGYSYRCDICGAVIQARYHSEAGVIEFDH